MKLQRRFWVFAFSGMACLLAHGRVSAAPATQASLPFPALEDYGRELQAYFAACDQFLATQPNSPYAPRVAWEACQTVQFAGLQGASTLQAVLLTRYPLSLQCALMIRGLKDADEFRGLVGGTLDRWLAAPAAVEAGGLVAGIKAGLGRFGADLFNDSSFALRVLLLGRATGDGDLLRLAKTALEPRAAKNRALKAQMDACLDPRGDAEALLTLQGHRDTNPTRQIQSYFIWRLSPQEQARPDLARIIAEVRLDASDFKEALAALTSLGAAVDGDATLRYWRGLALAGSGQWAKAADDFDAVAKDPKSAAWGAAARELAPALRQQEALQKEYARQIPGVLSRLREKAQILELNATYQPEKAGLKPFSAYLSFQGERDVEAHIRQDKDLAFAIKLSEKDTLIYIKGQDSIMRMAQGVVPVPRLGIERDADKKFTLSAGMSLANSGGALAQSAGSLLTSPYLSTTEGLTELLGYSGSRGIFVMPIAAVGGGQRLSICSPKVVAPDLQRFDLELSADGDVTAITKAGFRCTLRYGIAGAFAAKPPQWPTLKITSDEGGEAATFMRLMGTIVDAVKSLDSDAPATQP